MALGGRHQLAHAPGRAAVMLCALFACCLSGCATNRYAAAKLPVNLQAPAIANAQTVDLTRLSAARAASTTIDDGDVLEVSIAADLSDDDTVTFPVRVDEEGDASLPGIGDVPVSGLELEGAEAAIATAAIHRGLYTAPHVTVTMKKQRVNRVTVVGAVKNPGIYELPRGSSDLLAALVAAGSLAPDAGTNVEIRNPESAEYAPHDAIAGGSMASVVDQAGYSSRPPVSSGPKITQVNLVEATSQSGRDYHVNDGGLVMVEKRDPQAIHVLGLVARPGRYDFPVQEELRVLDAIALAGGTKVSVADKVFVIRNLPQQPEPAVILVSLRKAKQDGATNLRLAPGDRISVEHTPATAALEVIQILRFGIGASLGTLAF